MDLSNPLLEESDTLYYSADSYDVYTYNKKLNQTFHSTPKFTVTQDGRDDGSFGIDTYTITDANGELTLTDLYSVGANGVTYTHGGAIFVMQDNYTFHLKGYEEYVNPDKTPAETSTVPLAGSVVTINNAPLVAAKRLWREQ